MIKSMVVVSVLTATGAGGTVGTGVGDGVGVGVAVGDGVAVAVGIAVGALLFSGDVGMPVGPVWSTGGTVGVAVAGAEMNGTTLGVGVVVREPANRSHPARQQSVVKNNSIYIRFLFCVIIFLVSKAYENYYLYVIPQISQMYK